MSKAYKAGQVCAAEDSARNQNREGMAERRWNEEKRCICSHSGGDRGPPDAADGVPILKGSDGQCKDPGGACENHTDRDEIPEYRAGHRTRRPPCKASGVA